MEHRWHTQRECIEHTADAKSSGVESTMRRPRVATSVRCPAWSVRPCPAHVRPSVDGQDYIYETPMVGWTVFCSAPMPASSW